MPQKPSAAVVTHLLQLAHQLTAASGQVDFYEILHQAHRELLDTLETASPSRRSEFELSVRAAFTQAGAKQQLRRMLEVLLWPCAAILPIPAEDDAAAENMWLFTLPIRVTLAESELDKVLVLHGDFVPVEDLLQRIEAANLVNPLAELSALSSLYRRDDFFAYGPLELPGILLALETGSTDEVPAPLPIILDSDMPGHRVLTLNVLLGARMPKRQHSLFRSRVLPASTVQFLESAITQRFAAEGMVVEAVSVDELSTVSESYLFSGGVMLRELLTHIAVLRETFGESAAFNGRVQSPGFFELNVCLEDGQEILGIPPFAFVEPLSTMRTIVEKACKRSGAPFRDVAALSPSQTSAMMH